MLRILSALIFLSGSALAIAESPKNIVEWGKLASLNLAEIEQQSRSYIQLNRLDLNGVEIKWVQTTADYSRSQGPSLEVVFLHGKSLKPIEESQLLGPLQNENRDTQVKSHDLGSSTMKIETPRLNRMI